jgi:hypothetical protein
VSKGASVDGKLLGVRGQAAIGGRWLNFPSGGPKTSNSIGDWKNRGRASDVVTAVLWITYLIGIIVSSLVYNHRAGLADIKRSQGVDWREFARPNPGWMVLTYGKILAWWAVLIAWLLQGRPPSPWRATTKLDGREVRAILRVSGTDMRRRGVSR